MALIWLRFYGLSGDARYLDATREVLANHRGLSFRNECFVLSREAQ